MNTREMVAVMQAYEDGKQIEVADCNTVNWEDCPNPVWNWTKFNYRIKATKTPVDLSVLIDSGTGGGSSLPIDCEISVDLERQLRKLQDAVMALEPFDKVFGFDLEYNVAHGYERHDCPYCGGLVHMEGHSSNCPVTKLREVLKDVQK